MENMLEMLDIDELIELKMLAQKNNTRKIDLDSSNKIYQRYRFLQYAEVEYAILVCLDTKNNLICEKLISKGTINGALVSSREVFRTALLNNSVGIVLLHNHPSGNSEPSDDDIKLTKNIKKAGKMIGIPLLDHIIIGTDNYTSFGENKIL